MADVGAGRQAQGKGYLGDDSVPRKAWCDGFLLRRPELRRIKAAVVDKAHAKSATTEAIANYFAALTAVTVVQDYVGHRGVQHR